jgi:hypothetical protein
MQLFMAISQYLCNRLLKGKTARFIASIICYIVLLACVGILYIKFPDFFDSKLIIFYSVFFLFGYLYSFCEKRVSIMTSEKYRIICILLMLSLIVVVMLRHPSVINESETVPNLIERVIGSAASIILMMNICHFACKIKIVEKVAAFGTLSLEMYYIHLLLLKIPLINDKVPNGSTFIIKYCGLVILALIVIFMIKSIWLLDLLFFGKMPRKSERKKLL